MGLISFLSFMKPRSSRIVCAVALVCVLVSGCQTVSPAGQAVTIVDAESVFSCELLAEVVANPPFVGPGDAKAKLRNSAGALWANRLVITKYGVGPARGLAYLC